ncbi:uncharacterized protein LOC101891335 [Musca domestica]|uniref:Uncharacterized protein LOC101891335 n=1 Tax=Musca domestica TaxID=7370 RepID=A0A9J7CLW6_MUSDO|nr:uncharacterized protein LOC101891335 [Musca domestica]
MCCPNMRTLSLIVGWIHLILAVILAISTLIYLCTYNNQTYEDTIIEEKISNTGLPTLVFLFLFSVASVIFDIMLLKGISEERHKLMSPFVFGNYVALGIQTCLTVYNVFKDLIDSATFGDLMIHLILNSVTLGIMIFFFYPIYQVYQQIRWNSENPMQPQYDNAEAGVKPIESANNGIYVN